MNVFFPGWQQTETQNFRHSAGTYETRIYGWRGPRAPESAQWSASAFTGTQLIINFPIEKYIFWHHDFTKQSKQSPVDELLRKSEVIMMSSDKPKAEIYKAMADTLARAWQDINDVMERRKSILEQNVLFKL